MRIALDAMGGDHAPGEIVKGAIEAAEELHLQILLVGRPDAIEPLLKEASAGARSRLDIVAASEVIAMDESPATALRKKKDASIVVATRLVKEGRAQALVSAGSTGAQMAASLLGLGRISGIDRPAIATILPTLEGGKLLLDVGANSEAKPRNLLQFAHMGSIYAEKVMGIANPRVALLNIGEEETKGNELVLGAYGMLREAPLHFIGNVEGRDIFFGRADVIVCDGFVGNVVLKFGEGMVSALKTMIKDELKNSRMAQLGALLAAPALRGMGKRLDYAEYGGAPLLGVNGVSIICHGSSKAKAIKNALRVARQGVQQNFIAAIQEHIPGKVEPVC
ncbi:fatty acid/phospholipid synthesis protein plsx [Heliomicrobium modesticaldum Ice1]|uniref:Phosphate acyltransferase n=1 Tax=Heliobacterium modesticaldum (strain ATCC 51547 / Ice1) TaxID=498761 RepID=PLSX_HELMI|nr:phosphate acyltransferase PlsX [Heliomicrobium modesticaldum]B0TGV6.1 RecName: Full=Phosphate acyltransferase; AltName: Full=Acyl-ACP phosphotransacylase; AltName: Full=Acyl-[acyl-carrier-protein]--phosphate acyltransferase; AltName: Full=Phosphate-acyl-ACP acyltransferase [Heliomicrobium modesticaldum Ice1]ABZ84717.1 fatty acid/phospholipid synthesis protein plsx [Heliomicrobium modesticaldum Ice1]